ncbi:MAG: hypothetical protein J6W86_01420 [Bacteroidales bacterium]|jgi:hypothetical protein|nr:hypothetical protein [Bacteroidales bacterium]
METKNTKTSKAKAFFKENRKQIIWLAVTIIAAWFILELISNWSAFSAGFQEGMNK